MRLRSVTACVVACVVTFTAGARADTPPNAWDAAKDPAARERYAVHIAVREAIAMERHSSIPAGSHRVALDRARLMLEQAHAEQSPDAVLRFDLGEVYSLQQHYQRVIDVLEPALQMAPDHPAALDAFVALANAYAQLDRSLEERDVYERYLARTTDDRSRAIAILNMAEADMHLGNLTEAVAGYREAIQLAAALPNIIELEDSTGALAVWGLAVALDRSGDVSGGAVQARLATQLDPGMRIIKSGRNVFFVPAYERKWYLALGYTEEAKLTKSSRDAAAAWAKVEAQWTDYVAQATANDRWLALARVRRDRAHAQRVAEERRAGKQAPPRVDHDLTF
jgi:tetratricopeptide (TPR) repeat protein